MCMGDCINEIKMLIPPREPDPIQRTNLLFMALTGVHFQIQTVSCKPGVSHAL